MKGMIGLVVIVAGTLVAGCVNAATANAEALAAQNPFAVIAQLTEFSYGELARMYPALSDGELRSLRWRIVNHMQGLE